MARICPHPSLGAAGEHGRTRDGSRADASRSASALEDQAKALHFEGLFADEAGDVGRGSGTESAVPGSATKVQRSATLAAPTSHQRPRAGARGTPEPRGR
jgi:hypothetical protein